MNPGNHGDGWCDDVNNNEACFFDGGDCCGGIISPNYCTVCQCFEGGGENNCNVDWIADGYCDDINNNLDCSYDGGDCCGGIINPNYCTICQCLEGGGGGSGGTTTPSGTTTSGGCNEWIGDGYCDDINNNQDCSYDDGDCCGSNVNTQYCNICQCLEGGGGGGSGGTTTIGACSQSWIADGYCDDINNNLACSYDGGDCCGSNANTQYCTECICYE